jgi:dTDP-4-dehydrorhamnose reductase
VKALVFGAGGQLGRALVASAPTEVEVLGLGRADCNIGDQASVARTIEAHHPDLVFNAAAYTAVDRAESEPEEARMLNGLAPGWIAEATRAAGGRFVHISTDFVFDGQVPRPLMPADPVAPLGVYGRTKAEGEQTVAAADEDGLIVRTAWVYAAEGANFVNTMLRLMRERDEVRVVADQVGTPTWARSLASALWTLAADRARGLHHFTDAGVASWYDFAVAIQEEACTIGLLDRAARIVPISTADYPTPAKRPAFSVLDKSATWNLIGGPAPHWRANLRACLQEHLHG